jgi:hypothetical protein
VNRHAETAGVNDERYWNRYYDPQVGRYLQPEPKLNILAGPGALRLINYGYGVPPEGGPDFVEQSGKAAMTVNAYAYAADNPLFFADADGLGIYSVSCGPKTLVFQSPQGTEPCKDCETATALAEAMGGCYNDLAKHICAIAAREGANGKGTCGKPQACGGSTTTGGR